MSDIWSMQDIFGGKEGIKSCSSHEYFVLYWNFLVSLCLSKLDVSIIKILLLLLLKNYLRTSITQSFRASIISTPIICLNDICEWQKGKNWMLLVLFMVHGTIKWLSWHHYSLFSKLLLHICPLKSVTLISDLHSKCNISNFFVPLVLHIDTSHVCHCPGLNTVVTSPSRAGNQVSEGKCLTIFILKLPSAAIMSWYHQMERILDQWCPPCQPSLGIVTYVMCSPIKFQEADNGV